MLLVIANCSLECNCQQLLAENSVVETLLPFCKSDYFGIRLGAKSSLSSISTSVAKQHHLRFFQMNKHEHVALFNTLKEFSEAGSYRKRFQTTLCDYYFSALDLLLLLNALMENSFNKELVQSSNISLTLSQFLTTGTKLEKDIVVELLWRLCRSQTMRLHVLSYVPHHIQDELPIEVFNTEKPLQFSCDSTSHLLDANARPDSSKISLCTSSLSILSFVYIQVKKKAFKINAKIEDVALVVAIYNETLFIRAVWDQVVVPVTLQLPITSKLLVILNLQITFT